MYINISFVYYLLLFIFASILLNLRKTLVLKETQTPISIYWIPPTIMYEILLTILKYLFFSFCSKPEDNTTKVKRLAENFFVI